MPDAKLRAAVQQSIAEFKKKGKSVWAEVIDPPTEATPHERFLEFMTMTPDVRAGLVNEMGPEGYAAHVQQMLTIGEDIMGPSVWNVEPYFLQDFMGTPQGAFASPEAGNLDSLLDQAMAMDGNEWLTK